MRVISPLSPKEYLKAVKGNMYSHFEFGHERFTGFFLGRIFYVTYHSGWEWGRKITNQKNAALGFVRKTATGCNVHFLGFRGLLCPILFIQTYLLLMLYGLVTKTLCEMYALNMAVLMLFYAPCYTFFEFLTAKSLDGRRCLLSMLLDPTDPLANYYNV